MNIRIHQKRTLLLVDDEPVNLQVLRYALENDYNLIFAKSGQKALELANDAHPDLILLDIMMPEMSGYEVCKALKDNSNTRSIPVIFVTSLDNEMNEEKGLELGAVDYITKPVSPAIVRARVRTHLSLVQAEVVLQTRLSIIQSLGIASEYRDNETGMHVIRISYHARRLALDSGYSEDAADELFYAAPMHDVGKIGIPDTVLLKPGKLEPHEWEIMKQHTKIGAQIIGNHDASLLRMASTVALRHHEKWNGSGYPDGLSGENIPHQARIIAVVDVFDALLSERPYKKPWPLEKVIELLYEERGKHFDPALVDTFLDNLPAHQEIQEKYGDNSSNANTL
ncbi:Response regulator receiver:metal-dependent phosphohydrolase, HD subdomain [gamma proteobacterium HdN1]|nr:Response regulator receiver:metal-dependent phosphohydrolase, HD subdomain [gamma proteobacterium HdN1]